MAIELSRQGGLLKYKDTVSGFFKVLNLNSLKVRIDQQDTDFTKWSDGSHYPYMLFDTPTFANSEELVNQIGTWKEEAKGGGGSGAVDSVFGRTGVVTAVTSDYDASQIDNDSSVSGATVADALDNMQNGIPAWAQYSDTTYTTGSRFSITGNAAAVNMPNDSGSVIDAYMPVGLEFYDGVSGLITPNTVGETYDLRINFKGESTTNQNFLTISLDIGGALGVILEKVVDFPRGQGIEHSFSSSNIIYALGTFVANGGQLKISADDDAEIWDVSYYIVRTSGVDIDLPDAPSDGNQYARQDGLWAQVLEGGSAYCEESFQFSNADATQTSANTVYAVKGYANSTTDITSLGFECSASGSETVTLGIYDESLNLLVSGDITNPVVGKNTVTVATTTLTAGGVYWFAIKGSLGSSTWYKRTTISDSNITRSVFFGSAGLPNPLGGFASDIAPFIIACS